MQTPISPYAAAIHSILRFICGSILLLLIFWPHQSMTNAQTDQEMKKAEARELFFEGLKLARENNKEAFDKALGKFAAALPLFRAQHDTFFEGATLVNIGFIYDALGELEKAVDYFKQALPLTRAIGDQRNEAVALSNIGKVYNSSGKKQEALEQYAQAIPLHRAVGDLRGEAVTLNNIGMVYLDLNEQQKAIDHLTQALSLFRKVEDHQSVAMALDHLGRAYNAAGERQKALEDFTNALSLFRRLGDRRGEARTLNDLGDLYVDAEEWHKALEPLTQALSIFRMVEDYANQARTLNNLAAAYAGSGESRKALEQVLQALPLKRTIGDREGEAVTLNHIGGLYLDLNEHQKAVDYLKQALSLFQSISDRKGEALALRRLGDSHSAIGESQQALAYYALALPISRALGERDEEIHVMITTGKAHSDLGNMEKALDYFTQALLLSRAVGNRGLEGSTLSNIGRNYANTGKLQQGLDYYAQALPLNRAVKDRHGEAATLNNIGSVYIDLGEGPQALVYLTQALSLLRAVKDRRGEAVTLHNIGRVYSILGDQQKALDYYNQSLPLRRASGDRQGESITLSTMGGIYESLEDTKKAADHYTQALTLSRFINDPDAEAVALNNIASLYTSSKEWQKALEHYMQALSLNRALGDRQGEANTLGNIAYLERERGDLRAALKQIEAALHLIESLRLNIASQELRASYLAKQHANYGFYIDLLMLLHKESPSAGYDRLALEASERGRARSLLEILEEARTNIRQGVDPKLIEREHNAQQQLKASLEKQMQLARTMGADKSVYLISDDVETSRAELQQIEAEIRKASPRYGELSQPHSLTLDEIQAQLLDPDTLLLEYSLGNKRSYLWAVTATTVTSYELPKREEIETVARQFYELISGSYRRTGVAPRRSEVIGVSEQNANAARLQAGAQLSRMLLAPVKSRLAGKRLLIIADGALQYIPFAALPKPADDTNGNTPLIVEHEIVNLPSASTLAALRRQTSDRPPSSKTLAILADPVFAADDERLRGLVSKFPSPQSRSLDSVLNVSATQTRVTPDRKDLPRLPGTRHEANEIVKLVPKNQYRSAFDFAANRATATDADLSRYRYIHFATHGFLNSDHPEFSGLALSMFDERGVPQDGFLRLSDIFNLKLAADMVVLSACQTGLGKDVRGEGLVGLTRALMYAGSPRVVVSLWNVNDAATAELMTRFYRGILVEKLRPAKALQAAQLSMFNDKRYAAPFYWAAFTLQGEWH